MNFENNSKIVRKIQPSAISGFLRGVPEIFALLRFYET
jgi:hypothetical protein